MRDRPKYLELRCRACHWSEVCGPKEIAGRLRGMGKLREGRMPELAILYALFQAAVPAVVCPECGQADLKVGPASDGDGWPEPVPCAACGKPISPERLEAVRGTRFCAGCQRESDSGRPRPERDYCPQCGAALEVRIVQTGSSTRYVLACSNNPPCDLG